MVGRSALVGLVALFAACAEPGVGAPDERVLSAREGRVLDGLSGAPIEGAAIEVEGGERARADAEGRFWVRVPTGAAVRASAPGFVTLTRLDAADLTLRLWPERPGEAAVEAHLARLEEARGLRDDPRDPALRPAARALLLGARTAPPRGDVGAVRAGLTEPPATIRVWRRSIDGESASCQGRIDVIPLEDYVRGVLPHEWIASWHDESLRAGALAIRTYAWRWIERGGKYDCADLDDTARSQVYRDDRNARATAAVDDTASMAITRDGALVTGEYSAENGDPTDYGVADPLCAGREIRGHRRGMCQWGSQRWADQDGRDHVWIAEHYWPGAIVERADDPRPDFDARLVARFSPEELAGGETAEVYFELENTGRMSWMETVRLEADGASALRDASWLDAPGVTAADAMVVAPGETARFSFRVRAPRAAGRLDEGFVLTADGVAFGPPLELSLTVRAAAPTPADAGGASDAGASVDAAGLTGGRLESGCAARPGAPPGTAGLLLLALVWLRRRQP